MSHVLVFCLISPNTYMHTCIHAYMKTCDCSQAATEPNVRLTQLARQHGWTIDDLCRKRVQWRVKTFLKRTAHCFSALTEEEMSQYLTGHADVRRLSPIMENREKTVDRLIELRLPAPELSTNSSRSFMSILYGLMPT